MKHSIRKVLYFSFLLFTGVLLSACEKNGSSSGPDYKKIEAARSAMVNWLECEECTEGELKAVLAHKDRLQPMFISSLNKGVAPASLQLYKYDLGKRYDELVAASRTNPRTRPTVSKDAYIKLYLGNFVAQYKVRSAKALSAIGGEKSKQAIKEALGREKRKDVVKALKDALEKAK